jgi:hypothetical protein
MLWLGQDVRNQRVELQPQTLLRHAVCLGASGSGKTVACKVLCEEILLQGIPVLAVDPQGDISSMLFSADSEEVKEHDLPIERVEAFQKQVEVVVWTPGSEIGIPVSLNPLRLDNLPTRMEQRTRLLSSIASSLTSLLGYNLDSNDGRYVSATLDLVFQHLVRTGQNMEGMDELARIFETPPETLQQEMNRLLDPRKQQEVVRKLTVLGIGVRRLLFQLGTPLDIDVLLGTSEDSETTRLSVIYLNTLHSQGEKEFFVSQLAQALVDWMLEHPSPELQAAFYMDEVAPFFPPIRKPACKASLQFLFKQARKYGISCLLATQNPGDIDYRGLSQFSTWMLGRMMVQQDLKKVSTLLRSLHPTVVEDILQRLPSLETGQFFLVSPDAQNSDEPFQVRWLLTKHRTLDEEQLEMAIPEELRERFQLSSAELWEAPEPIEKSATPEANPVGEPEIIVEPEPVEVEEPSQDPTAEEKALLQELSRKLLETKPVEILEVVESARPVLQPVVAGGGESVSSWAQEAWPISPSISYSPDDEKLDVPSVDVEGLESKLQLEKAWTHRESLDEQALLKAKLQRWKELESNTLQPLALPEAVVEEENVSEPLRDEFKVNEAPKIPTKPKERRQLLLHYLETSPGAYSVAELNEILTLNESSLRRHLRSLKLTENPEERVTSVKMGRVHYYWLEKHGFAPTYSVSRPLKALPFRATVDEQYARDLAGRHCESSFLVWRKEKVGQPQPRYLLCWCLEVVCEQKKNVLQRIGNFLRTEKDARIVLYFHATTGKLMQKERQSWIFQGATPQLSQQWKGLYLDAQSEWKTPGSLHLRDMDLRALRTSEGVFQQWETELLSFEGVQSIHNPRQLLALPYWEVPLLHHKTGRERKLAVDGLEGVVFALPQTEVLE